jgi:hypothetical protein
MWLAFGQLKRAPKMTQRRAAGMEKKLRNFHETLTYQPRKVSSFDGFRVLGFSGFLILCRSAWSSWASYKINQTTDKIGVFVSIVSTKIPFKGTGKEYIGDDIPEIAAAVKVRRLPCWEMHLEVKGEILRGKRGLLTPEGPGRPASSAKVRSLFENVMKLL